MIKEISEWSETFGLERVFFKPLNTGIQEWSEERERLNQEILRLKEQLNAIFF